MGEAVYQGVAQLHDQQDQDNREKKRNTEHEIPGDSASHPALDKKKGRV